MATVSEAARYETVLTAKLTLFAFIGHLLLQAISIPLLFSTTTFLILAWVLTAGILVTGLFSDMNFYPDEILHPVSAARLACNLVSFIISWGISLHFFEYLSIPIPSYEDKIPGLDMIYTIYYEFGYYTGCCLLLFTHFFTTWTITSMMRTGVVVGDLAFKFAAYIINKV